MNKKALFYTVAMLMSLLSSAQPVQNRLEYDISKEKVLYTVGYSHLDTQWNWTYPVSIDEYLRNIMNENFYLFEKYPDYVFNFTGSRRYRMMKEYYPELYKEVGDYIRKGRWYVSGSSVDEGEVNISSSESLVRQVLYGNRFFKQEFGKESKDYMLPDCFGFLANVPSIWNHCGLLGFSTQKLTWRSASGIPFNVGVWNGPDGKGIIAALNATKYTGQVVPHLDQDKLWIARMDENKKKYGNLFDYRYYGVGDEGGAPRENDVRNVLGSLPNDSSKIKVVLTSSDQMYKDITPELRKQLPVYKGDLLLIEHSAGSLTSQSFMKTMNRKNELLAKAAEQMASVANCYGVADYPFTKLNNAWELVLGSQMHDILPGTSIPKAYEYAWNDEFVAANGFSEVLKNSVSRLSSMFNTTGEGRSILVYNPVSQEREDVVTVAIPYENYPGNIQVFDSFGKAIPTQIVDWKENKLTLLFLAKVPSVGLAVFDVREVKSQNILNSALSVSMNSMDNQYYKVLIDKNGDISSIYDKYKKKELLVAPARLLFMEESPEDWPAWNMDWEDRKKSPLGYLNDDISIKIMEKGPVRVSIQIERKARNSSVTQVIRLSAGEAGKRIEVSNMVDWQSTGVSLKASFPLNIQNSLATYNLGVGTVQRGNNDSVKFEVPSKEWFDLTDKSSQYGVSILEDCKYGSDKPDDHTLRLTLLFTPEANKRFYEQSSQDWGIHRFKYGIYGHSGNWNEAQTTWQGKFFNQPLLAFEVPKHNGTLGKVNSFFSVKTSALGLMAYKKAEDDDYYVIRVNELYGRDHKNIEVSLPGDILDAYEINGQEKSIGGVVFSGKKLTFDISHYTIKSFAVKLAKLKVNHSSVIQKSIKLPFNEDVMSFDSNRDDARFIGKYSFPAENVPDEITSDDIVFQMGKRDDGEKNAVGCNGQEIEVPEGDFSKLYLLAAATEDTEGIMEIAGKSHLFNVQNWTGFIGQYYNREFAKDGKTVIEIKRPFSKQGNIAWFSSHRHYAYPSRNESYQYCYLFKYEIDIPKGTKTIKLPENEKIKVLAATAVRNANDSINPLQALYEDFNEWPVSVIRKTN